MPGYFVRVAPGGGAAPPVEVLSVSTGAVIATVRPPKPPRGGALDIGAVAAAPDDRTFYVEYGLVSPNINVTQTWILTFSITGSGSVTPLTMVKGGLLSHQPPGLQTWGGLAVSPDGSKLALTVDSSDHISSTSPGYSDKIIVIDLHTGQRTQWQGGLYRPGKTVLDPGPVLVRRRAVAGLPRPVVRSCRAGHYLRRHFRAGRVPRCPGLVAQRGDRRRLAEPRPPAAAAIGPVPPHRASTRRPRWLPTSPSPSCPVRSEQAVNWRVLTVEDVSAATGAVRHVDYGVSWAQGFRVARPQQVWLAADPSGQHLLVSYAVDGGFIIGWIGHGALHRLPITQPYLPNNPTLIIAW